MGKAAVAAEKIYSVIDLGSKVDAVDIPNSAKDIKISGKIEFKDVWFRYPERPTHWVLKGFNLTIEPNQSVALVGDSGAGKSTLIGLVLRFYDADFGEIFVDGVNIKDINIKSLRSQMGLV